MATSGRPKKVKELDTTTNTCCKPTRMADLRELNLNEAHKEMLRRTPFMEFVEMHDMYFQAVLVHQLIERWVDKENSFKVGDILIPFTVNDVVHLTGLKNGGTPIPRMKGKGTSTLENELFGKEQLTANTILKKLKHMVEQEGADGGNVVRLYIAFIFATMLFAKSNQACNRLMFDYLDDLALIRQWNWADAVYEFLVDSIREVYPKVMKKSMAPYICGASFILQVCTRRRGSTGGGRRRRIGSIRGERRSRRGSAVRERRLM